MSSTELFTEVIDDFLAERCTAEVAAQSADDDGPRALWREMESLGFTAVLTAEADDSGGTFADACALVRAAGRHAVPLPVAETAMLGGWLMALCGLPMPAGPVLVACGSAAAPLRIGDGVISGRSIPIRWSRCTESVVILARDDDDRPAVVTVAPDAVALTVRRPDLGGDAVATVDADGATVGVAPVGRPPVWVDEDELIARGALMRSIAIVGALERIQQLTIAYAKDRHQFGRPIARFQAVQGLLAELARDVAVARAAVDLAAGQAVTGEAVPRFAVAAAKVMAGRAARSGSRRAHQVHGAIGVTTDYPLHLATTRVLAWREDFGDEQYWAAWLGRALLESEGGLWPAITATRPGFEL